MTMTRGGFFKTVAAVLGAARCKPQPLAHTAPISHLHVSGDQSPSAIRAAFPKFFVAKHQPEETIDFFCPKNWPTHPYQARIFNVDTPKDAA